MLTSLGPRYIHFFLIISHFIIGCNLQKYTTGRAQRRQQWELRVKAGEGDDVGKGLKTRMRLEFGMFFLFFFIFSTSVRLQLDYAY